MIAALTNTPRDYAWGSRTALAELFGRPVSGGPEAEFWLGAHPASPSRLLAPGGVGGQETLDAWIAADPQQTLGSRFAAGKRLPFLLKVLAIDAPLSLQAHPTPAQAEAGFARENLAGLPADAPERNYRDAFSKPELVYALSDTFDALCGFRAPAEVREIVAELRIRGAYLLAGAEQALLADFQDRITTDGLPALVDWLCSGNPAVVQLIAMVTRLTALPPQAPAPRFPAELATVRLLAEAYPHDAGIVMSLLLNRVTLTRGQALYLPAGNIHAYLRGVGVELMAASDNVLRGGLTPKHVDVAELLRVLDFCPVPAPFLVPEIPMPGVQIFRPDVPDFALVHFDGSATATQYAPHGPAIALCTRGSVELTGAASVTLTRGDAVFITPDEGTLTVSGGGELFLATTG